MLLHKYACGIFIQGLIIILYILVIKKHLLKKQVYLIYDVVLAMLYSKVIQLYIYIYTHIYIIFKIFFPLWFIIGYWTWFPVLYSRTLSVHCLSTSLHLLAPASCTPSLSQAPLPWQPQVCFLCLCVCFWFTGMFICVIFQIPHRSDIKWYLYFQKRESSKEHNTGMEHFLCGFIGLKAVSKVKKVKRGHKLWESWDFCWFWSLPCPHCLEGFKVQQVHM